MCWCSKRSQTWGVTDCHLYGSFRMTCHRNPVVIQDCFHRISSSNEYRKASMNHLSLGSAPVEATSLLPWSSQRRNTHFWPWRIVLPLCAQRKQNVASSPQPLAPSWSNSDWTVWLRQTSNTELLTQPMVPRHEATSTGEPSSAPMVLRLEHPVQKNLFREQGL